MSDLLIKLILKRVLVWREIQLESIRIRRYGRWYWALEILRFPVSWFVTCAANEYSKGFSGIGAACAFAATLIAQLLIIFNLSDWLRLRRSILWVQIAVVRFFLRRLINVISAKNKLQNPQDDPADAGNPAGSKVDARQDSIHQATPEK